MLSIRVPSMTIPYWQVGMKIGAESGQVNVHSDALPDATWQYAVEHAMQTARIINPIEKIEFLYVKEYN